tara:strand:- start:19353 stop:19724 length:372 start_codon:yes stop_codon:yes gene_type:complete
MFDFFKKQKPDVQPKKEEIKDDTPDVVAAVTYYMTSEGQAFVDVEMKEFDDAATIMMAALLSGINTGLYSHDTLEMLRNGLLEEDRTDLYLLLITKLASVFADSTKDEGDEDEPLISPSEVLD